MLKNADQEQLITIQILLSCVGDVCFLKTLVLVFFLAWVPLNVVFLSFKKSMCQECSLSPLFRDSLFHYS